jgi:hypothetical protein
MLSDTNIKTVILERLLNDTDIRSKFTKQMLLQSKQEQEMKNKRYITFIKDLLIWIFMMFLAYIIYKKFSKGNSSIINNN